MRAKSVKREINSSLEVVIYSTLILVRINYNFIYKVKIS